jgi:hypothetical protein
LAFAVVLLCLLASVQFLVPQLSKPGAGEDLPPHVAQILWLLSHTLWIALGLGLLFALEAFLVLRRFAREEAQQRQNQQVSSLAKPSGA